jgi:hypothetical protein
VEQFSIVFHPSRFDRVVPAKQRFPGADYDKRSTINVRGVPHADIEGCSLLRRMTCRRHIHCRWQFEPRQPMGVATL